MAADDGDAHGRRPRFQPLGLLTAMLAVALVLAALFVSFLVLPLAILVVFYVGFAASDRARRPRSEPGVPPAGAAPRDDEPDAA